MIKIYKNNQIILVIYKSFCNEIIFHKENGMSYKVGFINNNFVIKYYIEIINKIEVYLNKNSIIKNDLIIELDKNQFKFEIKEEE